ncbi:MAG: hypothetical protein QXW72_01710 [Conexivisphaerales archaeon]
MIVINVKEDELDISSYIAKLSLVKSETKNNQEYRIKAESGYLRAHQGSEKVVLPAFLGRP